MGKTMYYRPTSASHPCGSILEYMECYGWSREELALRTGLPLKTLNAICNGKAPITPQAALGFERAYAMSARFWMNLQSNYDEFKAKEAEAERLAAWTGWPKNFPMKEMKRWKWIDPAAKSPKADLMNLLHFLRISSPDCWSAVWASSRISYRQTRNFSADEYAMAAWVRAVEISAEQLHLRQFDEKALIESLGKLRAMTTFDSGALEMAQETLARCGVAFVWQPELPNTGISGCTRWIGSDMVIVALSLRHKADDQVWFTFFHELGHVLKHRKLQPFILDNADDILTDGVVDPEMQRLEDEANQFAADTLIPPEKLREFIASGTFNNAAIAKFAKSIGIAPGIVVGRLQYEGILKNNRGNTLKRKVDASPSPPVSWHWM